MPTRKAMSVREWSTLSSSDKEVLRTLNLFDVLKPKKRAKPRTVPRNLPKPYILMTISTCKLCKTVSRSYFSMLPAKGNCYLLGAQRIAQESIHPSDTVVEKKESCTTCPNCRGILKKETKDELIKRILLLESKRR